MKRIKHGESKTKLYSRWDDMKQRVRRNPHYENVTIYESWNTYVNFRDWALANGFNESTNHTSIERRDSLGNYEPENCYFDVYKDQNKNRRNCKWWFVYGVKYETSQQAADFHGVTILTIRNWCEGLYIKSTGKIRPPKENCWSELKYPD